MASLVVVRGVSPGRWGSWWEGAAVQPLGELGRFSQSQYSPTLDRAVPLLCATRERSKDRKGCRTVCKAALLPPGVRKGRSSPEPQSLQGVGLLP